MSSGGHGGGGLPFLDSIQHWMHGAHEGGGTAIEFKPVVFAFLAEIIAFFLVAPSQSVTNFQFLLFASPVWIVLFAAIGAALAAGAVVLRKRSSEHEAARDAVLDREIGVIGGDIGRGGPPPVR